MRSLEYSILRSEDQENSCFGSTQLRNKWVGTTITSTKLDRDEWRLQFPSYKSDQGNIAVEIHVDAGHDKNRNPLYGA